MSSQEIDWPTVGATIGHIIKAATSTAPPQPKTTHKFNPIEYSMAFETLRENLLAFETLRENLRILERSGPSPSIMCLELTNVLAAAREVLAGYDEALAEGIGR